MLQCFYCNTKQHIQCLTCNTPFCNTRNSSSISHIIFHLVKSKHKSIKINNEEVKCQCGENNVFVLGYVEKGVVMCRTCSEMNGSMVGGDSMCGCMCGCMDGGCMCGGSMCDTNAHNAHNTHSAHSAHSCWQAVVEERCLATWIAGKALPSTHLLTKQHLSAIEDHLSTVPPTQPPMQPPTHPSLSTHLPPLTLSFTLPEYRSTLRALIKAEALKEKSQKEALKQENVKIRWETRGKALLALLRQKKEEAKICVGDEVRITHASGMSATGYVTEEDCEEVAVLVGSSGMQQFEECSVEFVWWNVGYERMLRAVDRLKRGCSKRVLSAVLRGSVGGSVGVRGGAVGVRGGVLGGVYGSVVGVQARGGAMGSVVVQARGGAKDYSTSTTHHSHSHNTSPTHTHPSLTHTHSTPSHTHTHTTPLLHPPGIALNPSQQQAVTAALTNTLTLIQGPPGTGKSVTAAAIVYNLLSTEGSILVVAPSNTAVDSLTLTLHRMGIPVTRILSKKREQTSSAVSFLTLNEQVKKQCPLCRGSSAGVRKGGGLQGASGAGAGGRRVRGAGVKGASGTSASGSGSGTGTPAGTPIGTPDSKHRHSTHSTHNTPSTHTHTGHRRTKKAILAKAKVITATCVTAGQKVLSSLTLPYVIIDEAVQCTEPLSLVPLTYGCKKLILIGDHRQLGPIVLDRAAASAGLKRSLFERLVGLGTAPMVLRTQYRMHPFLSEWTSNTFYGGMLLNGIGAASRRTQVPLPLPTFFYACYGRETVSASGTSFLNAGEAVMVGNVVRVLLGSGVGAGQIGIITPYEGQRVEILRRIGYGSGYGEGGAGGHQGYGTAYECYGHHNPDDHTQHTHTHHTHTQHGDTIEVANVDAFQGREKDFIILSLVRSNAFQGIGFVGDRRRMNVMLTRAKYGLIVIGNPLTFIKNGVWGDLLGFYQKHNLIMEGVLGDLKVCCVVGNGKLFDFSGLCETLP